MNMKRQQITSFMYLRNFKIVTFVMSNFYVAEYVAVIHLVRKQL